MSALLMGGQACVFYGAAEFSRDTDFVLLADAAHLERLDAALQGREAALETGLSEEERIERVADRAFWIPLKQELERMRYA